MTQLGLPVGSHMPGRHIAAGAAGHLEALVRLLDFQVGGAGGVVGGAGVAVEQHVVGDSHGATESGTDARSKAERRRWCQGGFVTAIAEPLLANAELSI